MSATSITKSERLKIKIGQRVDWLISSDNEVMNSVEDRQNTPYILATIFVHRLNSIDVINDPDIQFSPIKQDRVLWSPASRLNPWVHPC